MSAEQKLNTRDEAVDSTAFSLDVLRNPNTALVLGIFIGSISLPACISYSIEAIRGNFDYDLSTVFFASDTIALGLGYTICGIVLCAEVLDKIGHYCSAGQNLSTQRRIYQRVILPMLALSAFSSSLCMASSFICFYSSQFFYLVVAAVLTITPISLVARSNSIAKERELAARSEEKGGIRNAFGNIIVWAILSAAPICAPSTILSLSNPERSLSIIVFYITLAITIFVLAGAYIGSTYIKGNAPTESKLTSADARTGSSVSAGESSVAFRAKSSVSLDCSLEISIEMMSPDDGVMGEYADQKRAVNIETTTGNHRVI